MEGSVLGAEGHLGRHLLDGDTPALPGVHEALDARPVHLPRTVLPGSGDVALMTAETVILLLCATLLGEDGRGAGLLSRRVDGRFHTARCQIGQWRTPGGPRPAGDPCSARCEQARDALNQASRWLRAHEVEAPRQMPLLEVAG